MLAVNYATIQNKLNDYCDRVTNEYETVIVTCRDEKNVVIISLEEYNAMMRAVKNSDYLNMLDRSISQLENGKFITKSMAELEAMASLSR